MGVHTRPSPPGRSQGRPTRHTLPSPGSSPARARPSYGRVASPWASPHKRPAASNANKREAEEKDEEKTTWPAADEPVDRMETKEVLFLEPKSPKSSDECLCLMWPGFHLLCGNTKKAFKAASRAGK